MNDIKMKLKTLFANILRKIRRHRIMFVFDLDVSKIRFETMGMTAVDVRVAQSDDIPKLDRFKELGIKSEEWFEDGNLCFIVEKNGDIVHFAWVCLNEVYAPDLETKFRVGPNSAYIHSAYTVPEYRGMGIAPTVYMRILEYLSQGGIKKVFLIVDHHNFSQMRTLKKVGRQKIGEITLYRFLKLRIYRLKSETPEDYARLKEIWNART